jgi:hypothetical protein
MNDVEEDHEFKFLPILFNSDSIVFGLRELKSNKMIAVAQIDLKKLYESLSINHI